MMTIPTYAKPSVTEPYISCSLGVIVFLF
jgi:hypothetical protein